VTRGETPRRRWLAVPDAFVSGTLVAAGSAEAIKVGLHVLWRISRRPVGSPPALRQADLAADTALLRSLASCGPAEEVEARLGEAVDWLVTEGWLLDGRAEGPDGAERWLWPDIPEARSHRERWQSGEADLPAWPVVTGYVPPERPNVFALYEENIGPLAPILAEEIAEAEATYPAPWLEDAIRMAVSANVRRWSYVRAILERWEREGRGDETDRRRAEEGRGRDAEGPYAAYIQH
jgi:DnaD/phage-associated family protein